MGRVAKDAASKQARRMRRTYEGRDTSTSDSESSHEHQSKNIEIPRKRYRSKMPDVPYPMEAEVCAMEVDFLSRPRIDAIPSTAPDEDECQRFERGETAGSKKDKKNLIAALGRTYAALVSGKGNRDGITVFHSVQTPAITIDAYLARIAKYFDSSDSCLLMALIYIDRIIKLHLAFPMCDRSIHRILGVSLTVAAKFCDDSFYSNTYYAEVCGLTVKELNKLECEFLRLLAWNCYVSPNEYEEYRRRLLAVC